MSLSHQSLTKEQKQAVGILSIGTFLEYFDLMLYVHMAVLLNDLFFSKTDSFSSQLLSAFSFCITFIFRPVGALLIGWLGDNIGRRATVIITSFMMGITCIIMANLPTYNQVGIIAAWAITICRIIQGISSMGEKVGAEIYLTEFINPPLVYISVALMGIASVIGTTFAILIADISVSGLFNWRVAFWFGGIIAVIGMFARKTLRETTDFADAKRYINNICKNYDVEKVKIYNKPWCQEKINKKSMISFFLIQLVNPVYFYFVYVHSSTILKNKLGYSSADIIHHNFIIAVICLISGFFLVSLLLFAHPLKILKIRYYITIPFILFLPYILNNYIDSGFKLLIIQIIMITIPPTEFLAVPIFYKSFPVLKRFTASCLSYSIARAIMYIISSFGTAYLVKYFNNEGLLFLFIPILIGYGYGLFHFIKLESEKTGVKKEISSEFVTIEKGDKVLS